MSRLNNIKEKKRSSQVWLKGYCYHIVCVLFKGMT